jgi:hypothetical protein
MNITYKRDSIVPAPNDVLFGRGHKIYKHAGNQRYRSVIQSLKREYDAAPKSLRAVYGNQVVNYIQNLQPPGRFLKRQGKGDHAAWIEVETKSAVERARQALRDKKLPARLPKNSRPPNHCHDNLLVEGESIVDLNVFCIARNDQTGGTRSASSTHSPATSSSSPSPPTIHGSSTTVSTTDDSHDVRILPVHKESNQKLVRSRKIMSWSKLAIQDYGKSDTFSISLRSPLTAEN